MMYLILWEGDGALMPKDPKERDKLVMGWTERVKKDLESGDTKMWGVSIGGGQGFSITEVDPKDIYAKASTYMPYIKFDIRPMLTIDEMIETMKGMQK